ARLELGHIAHHHAAEEGRGVRPVDLVLVEWRDVEQAGRFTEGEVLAIVRGVEAADGAVARPVLPAIAGAQRLRALVKWRGNRHGCRVSPRGRAGVYHRSGRPWPPLRDPTRCRIDERILSS